MVVRKGRGGDGRGWEGMGGDGRGGEGRGYRVDDHQELFAPLNVKND